MPATVTAADVVRALSGLPDGTPAHVRPRVHGITGEWVAGHEPDTVVTGVDVEHRDDGTATVWLVAEEP